MGSTTFHFIKHRDTAHAPLNKNTTKTSLVPNTLFRTQRYYHHDPLESVQATSRSMEPTSNPRISFSSDFLDDKNFISITPKSDQTCRNHDTDQENFEFLSTNVTSDTMLTADELFFEGKLLPFWATHHAEQLNRMSLKPKELEGENEEDKKEKEEENKEETRISWLIDDDPSPRLPKCTVLWKELLKLRKQRAPPSLSSCSSSSSSSSGSLADRCMDGGKERSWNREKHVKRIKKELERTRSGSVRIRPVVHVPPCTQVKTTAFPPLFSLKKGSVER